MNIWPAIDLIGGEAVRLTKGDYAKKKVYFHHPEEILTFFQEAGASHLHLVDLEGALTGENKNKETIRRLAGEKDFQIDLGGGIREERQIYEYLEMGVNQVILGTKAVTDPVFLESMVGIYGDHIVVGIDVKDRQVAIHGWTRTLTKDVAEFARECAEMGVRRLIVTDISKDGMLTGTNLSLYRELREEVPVLLTASGGITTLEEIRELKALGLEGAILGKALYEGRLSLSEAVRIGES